MTFLSRTLSPSNISNYLNIVRLIHLQYGYPNPLDNALVKFQYSLHICGIKRSSDKATTRPKLPIMPTVLKDIRRQLTLTNSFDETFWVACLVAFYSFFRKANLLPPSRDKFDEHSHLRRSDLHLFSWGVVMVVQWKKNYSIQAANIVDPVAEGKRIVPLPSYCPGQCL